MVKNKSIIRIDDLYYLQNHKIKKKCSNSENLAYFKKKIDINYNYKDLDNNFNTFSINSNRYNTLSFIYELKRVIAKYIPEKRLLNSKLTDEQLSIVLGQTRFHIKKKKDQIKQDPNYIISIETLKEYKSQINKNLCRVPREISELFSKYIILNNPKKSIYGIYRWHPCLKIDYFEYIDTKEKAYWLGWLFAEAWLSKHGNNIRFGVELHKDDEKDLLDKFANVIGFNLEHKEIEIRREGDLTDYVRIRFVNDEFANSLIKHGFIVGNQKSKFIELPRLASRELYLAFILGYYDGDGKVGSTVITSGSINFIQQVKCYFKITYKIWQTNSEWEGIGYNIYLGMDLMREMLTNYEDSLYRKRKCFKLKKKN
ncbi:MAG: hypothetical protein ACFFB0_21980 [Promethearchaeota archaeon]